MRAVIALPLLLVGVGCHSWCKLPSTCCETTCPAPCPEGQAAPAPCPPPAPCVTAPAPPKVEVRPAERAHKTARDP